MERRFLSAKEAFDRPFFLVFLVIILMGCDSSSRKGTHTVDDSFVDPSVIYGVDNRRDLYQVSNPRLRELADSTVALMSSQQLTWLQDGWVDIAGEALGDRYALCEDEPFRSQTSAAFCSGFLVGPDLVVTAGHCVSDALSCQNTHFIFGYDVHANGDIGPQEVPAIEVYSCAELVDQELTSNGADYAVVRLDRPVEGHQPLQVRRQGSPAIGEDLVVVGHPSGLPKKIADGAQIQEVHSSYFVANLDTYGGNSGSAVFNRHTGDVEGILVRGETDYVWQGQCRVSNVCLDASCRGEDATLISQALHVIPEIVSVEPEEPVDPEEPRLEEKNYTRYSYLAIPDNNSSGITSHLNVDEAPQGRRVMIHVEIEHTWKGDLVVVVEAPDGRQVLLHQRSGYSLNNIEGTYGLDLEPVGDLSALSLVALAGDWKLRVSDHASWDQGQLIQWSVRLVP